VRHDHYEIVKSLCDVFGKDETKQLNEFLTMEDDLEFTALDNGACQLTQKRKIFTFLSNLYKANELACDMNLSLCSGLRSGICSII